ncbi:hypothetical protein ACFS7Z_08555 [Pontibacter toksunensis]|uniref:Uncharacterized protein n=1 Tax=Pontibacter toksunensis TaxID=1332631 RepID=A0ABW6BS96_9BACT
MKTTTSGLGARAKGHVGGRPKKMNQNKRKLDVRFCEEKQHLIDAVWRMIGIS